MLTNEAIKDIAYSFGFTDALLEKPAGKRARTQTAIASSQHVGLMLTGQGPQQQTSQAVHRQHQQAVVNGEAHQPVTNGVAAVAAADVVNGQVRPVPSTPVPNTSAPAVPMTPVPLRAPATPSPGVASGAPFTQLLEAAAGDALEVSASPAPLVDDPPVGHPMSSVSNTVHESGSASGAVAADAAPMEASGNNGDDGHQCAICLQVMDPSSITNPVEALPCSHTFHLACLSRWRATAIISDMSKCPLHPRPSQPAAGAAPQIEPLENSGEDFQIL